MVTYATDDERADTDTVGHGERGNNDVIYLLCQYYTFLYVLIKLLKKNNGIYARIALKTHLKCS